MSEYKVQLDSFAGPLDLLLYLVRKDEVDIYDIPIMDITRQYIQYIELLKQLDIDLAGDFLVMAATLMEIKSAMLLPSADIEAEAEGGIQDPRAELVRQLLEYKKFKDAANMLGGAAEERQLRFSRPDTILERVKPTQEPELDLDEVSIWTLLEAFDEILKATGNYQSYEHITDDTPIDLYQIELLNRLQSEGPMTLQTIFQGCQNRLGMIGLFLGMLELIRNQLVMAEQPGGAGPIYLKPLTSEPAETAVQNAIYRSKVEDEPEEEIQPDAQDQVEADLPEEDPAEMSIEDEIDDDDEFAKELSAIEIKDKSEQAPARPRIPIMEIAPQQPPVDTPEAALEHYTQDTTGSL